MVSGKALRAFISLPTKPSNKIAKLGTAPYFLNKLRPVPIFLYWSVAGFDADAVDMLADNARTAEFLEFFIAGHMVKLILRLLYGLSGTRREAFHA